MAFVTPFMQKGGLGIFAKYYVKMKGALLFVL